MIKMHVFDIGRIIYYFKNIVLHVHCVINNQLIGLPLNVNT